MSTSASTARARASAGAERTPACALASAAGRSPERNASSGVMRTRRKRSPTRGSAPDFSSLEGLFDVGRNVPGEGPAVLAAAGLVLDLVFHLHLGEVECEALASALLAFGRARRHRRDENL